MALSVTGGINLGAATVNPGYFNPTALQFTDDLDFIHGSHQISVGMDYIYALMNTANNRPTNGIYTFTGSTLSSNGSYGYADFLTGFLDAFLRRAIQISKTMVRAILPSMPRTHGRRPGVSPSTMGCAGSLTCPSTILTDTSRISAWRTSLRGKGARYL